MEVAFVDRPAWPEVTGVLAACLAVFVLLVALDGAAQRGEATRARKALAARAAAAQHPARPVATLAAGGTISLPGGSVLRAGRTRAAEAAPRSGHGLSSSILALIAGVGVMMALAGSALLARSSR